jgi:phospholipase/carboxylesterase
MHKKEIIWAGKKISEAKKALIMIHGRGATAEDILSLASHLHVNDYALLAPQATNYTWYPYSFMVPPAQNEPWLSSALGLVGEMTDDLIKKGISSDNIYFSGFSQGACLALEFVARNARQWGGVAAFTGGLIGDKIYSENYQGDFKGTHVFIGTSDPDPHVPTERVIKSADILKGMNAEVTMKTYPSMGHTINHDEIEKTNSLIFK